MRQRIFSGAFFMSSWARNLKTQCKPFLTFWSATLWKRKGLQSEQRPQMAALARVVAAGAC